MPESTIKIPDSKTEIGLVDPLLQKHIEKFYREKRKLDAPNGPEASPWELNGNFIRAAILAEIVESGMVVEDVDELIPGIVQWVANQIDIYMAEFAAVPKN